MLSRETLETYRQMTPGQRLEIALEMMRPNMERMFAGTPEMVERRFELLRRQNEDRNRRMLAAISRTGKAL
ncbi:MAG: hypothetical protein KF851_05495 [Pirellulaceae bacterium]|nr:hypothetical protein [Pirellulaceae bacterium]